MYGQWRKESARRKWTSLRLFSLFQLFQLLLITEVKCKAGLKTRNGTRPYVPDASFDEQQFSTLHLSIVRDHFRLARREVATSVIIHNGRAKSGWVHCLSLPGDKLHEEQQISHDCYTQSENSAHMFMYFSFDNRSTSGRIAEISAHLHPRVVSVQRADAADDKDALKREAAMSNKYKQSIDDDFFFRDNNQRGAFTIPSHCNERGRGRWRVLVSFLGYTFRYTQMCGEGKVSAGVHTRVHHNVLPDTIRYTDANNNGLNRIKNGSYVNEAGETTVVSAVEVRVSAPVESMAIGGISVVSANNDNVEVEIEEATQRDFVSSSAPWTAQVRYHCRCVGSCRVLIRLQVLLHPFDTHTEQWYKTCGRKHTPPAGLVVSTQRLLADLTLNGQVTGCNQIVGRRWTVLATWIDTPGGESWMNSGDVDDSDVDDDRVSIGGVAVHTSGGVKAWVEVSMAWLQLGKESRWTLHSRCWGVGAQQIEVVVGFEGGYGDWLCNAQRICSAAEVTWQWVRLCGTNAAMVAVVMVAVVKAVSWCTRDVKRATTQRWRRIRGRWWL